LINKILPSFGWVSSANIFRQVQQIVALIIYTHFLSPSEFGTFSIVLIFALFAGLFSNFGTSSAIIHFRDTSREFLSTIFIFNIFLGSSIAIILFFLSNPIASFFNDNQVELLLKIISINFILQSFFLVHKALLEMNMEFKIVSIIETVSIFIASIVGILAVWFFDFGVYGLVIQSVLNTIMLLVLFLSFSNWKATLFFDFTTIKKVLNYTVSLTSFNILNYFTNNIDQFLVGKFLASSSLGIYNLAIKIVIFPTVNIASIIVRVLFPVLSNYKSNLEVFKIIYLQIVFNIALITFPLMIGLMSLTDIFVETIFNEQWYLLKDILFLLAPAGLINTIVTTTGVIYTSNGNTKLLLKLGILNFFVLSVAFLIGIQYGIIGVAQAFLIVTILLMVIHLYFAWKEIELSLIDGFKKLIPVLVLSTIMGLVVNTLYSHELINFKSNVVNLLLYIFTGVLVYLSLIKLYFKDIVAIFKLPKIKDV